MLRLEILQPLAALDDPADLGDRPFLNPGRLELANGRKLPAWLPPAPGCLYLGLGGDLYGVVAGSDGTLSAPRKRGDLAEIVFRRPLLSRFADTRHAGFIFDTTEPQALAACLADDTEIDLPVAKARRLIEAGQRIFLSRAVINAALLAAVRRVGRENGRVAARRSTASAPSGFWTLRIVFGAIR